MDLGETISIIFIDYSSAFDTVSYRFLDETVVKTGASINFHTMLHAVHSSSSTFTTVPVPDGKETKSEVFSIRCGVVQGDITSPLYFILALELTLRRYDDDAAKGVPFVNSVLHTLGYADDVGLIDVDNTEGCQRTSERVLRIVVGSRDDAGMDIRTIQAAQTARR